MIEVAFLKRHTMIGYREGCPEPDHLNKRPLTFNKYSNARFFFVILKENRFCNKIVKKLSQEHVLVRN